MTKIVDINELPILTKDETSWIYNFLDCAITAELYAILFDQTTPQSDLVYQRSKALQPVVLEMATRGLLVDQAALTRVRDTLHKQLEKLQDQFNTLLREGYGYEGLSNWRSTQQLKHFLYQYLRLPIQHRFTSAGEMSETADRLALEKLGNIFSAAPAISLILLMRDIDRQLSFLKTKLDDDGRYRASYNIAGTVTGRLSSSYSATGTGANAQNIARSLRHIFIAPPGKKLANFDLEQADSRNVGATCWNRFLVSHGEAFASSYLDACEAGDLHTYVTRMARPELSWPADNHRAFCDQPLPELRGKSYRDLSKILGHGSNYLLTPASAAKKIKGLTPHQAKDFQTRYFRAFPCIPEWHKAVATDLQRTSTITTIFGRTRTFWGRATEAATIREGVSYEGQSPTADEINIGMLQVWRKFAEFPGFHILAQIHDSIVVEYPEEAENELIPAVKETLVVKINLAGGRPFHVPVEAKTGWNWGSYDSLENPRGMRKWE